MCVFSVRQQFFGRRELNAGNSLGGEAGPKMQKAKL